MTVIISLLSGAIGALVCWIVLRSRLLIPGSPAAQKEIDSIGTAAHVDAQKKAAEVVNASLDDISARVEQLRARGRSGK